MYKKERNSFKTLVLCIVCVLFHIIFCWRVLPCRSQEDSNPSPSPCRVHGRWSPHRHPPSLQTQSHQRWGDGRMARSRREGVEATARTINHRSRTSFPCHITWRALRRTRRKPTDCHTRVEPHIDHDMLSYFISFGGRGELVSLTSPAWGEAEGHRGLPRWCQGLRRRRSGRCHSDHIALLADDEIEVFEVNGRSGVSSMCGRL